MVKTSLSTALTTSSLDLVLPRRSDYGTVGKPIILHANYFELKGIKPDTYLYRYSIDFAEADISRAKSKRLIEILLQTPPFAERNVATDWSQKLVCAEKIPLEKFACFTLEWYPRDAAPYPPPSANETRWLRDFRQQNTYQARVAELRQVSLSELLRDLSQPAHNYPLKLEAIDALNIVIAYGPSGSANITTAAGNRFYPFDSHPQMQVADLGHAVQALRGYFASVRTSVNRVMVNVNVATSAFHKPGNLLESMKELVGNSPTEDRLEKALENEREHRRIAAFFEYVKV